jgi:hypothetical protein
MKPQPPFSLPFFSQSPNQSYQKQPRCQEKNGPGASDFYWRKWGRFQDSLIEAKKLGLSSPTFEKKGDFYHYSDIKLLD